ncbi:hypothetical protein BS50DRAFT_631764 [Corynespora cassiicola Philippines]|uniref:Uncharacterized protein n=1 Tax=Corynespora cassiicola Philippines TaxID=1448308 RepID=A0A2T2NWP6_CORCC|nr:hypothetical protein BS50DRAFT_631764 [Corynespora cassiicola Philippines]
MAMVNRTAGNKTPMSAARWRMGSCEMVGHVPFGWSPHHAPAASDSYSGMPMPSHRGQLSNHEPCPSGEEASWANAQRSDVRLAGAYSRPSPAGHPHGPHLHRMKNASKAAFGEQVDDVPLAITPRQGQAMQARAAAEFPFQAQDSVRQNRSEGSTLRSWVHLQACMRRPLGEVLVAFLAVATSACSAHMRSVCPGIYESDDA